MEHGIKNGTTNIHVSRTKLNKNTPLAFGLEGFFYLIIYSVGSSVTSGSGVINTSLIES